MATPTAEGDPPAAAGRFPRDLLAGLALLAFCAAVYVASLEIKDAPAALAQNVQPATFPRMVLVVITVLTVLMIALGIGRIEPSRRLPKLVMVATAALMIAFVMAFQTFGLLAAIFVFCLILPIVWGERPSLKLVIYALIFPIAVYIVFDTLLGVYFPPGIVETFIKSLI